MKNNELKHICIKNRTCYYFDETIKIEDFDFDNILLDEKSYKNFLIYSISNKTLVGAKPLCIWFNKVDRFIRVYDGSRYLVLFGLEKYDVIYYRIKYLISQKRWYSTCFSYNYAKNKIDSVNDLTLEETLTLHNVITIFKSVLNKNQSHYHYNIFFKKNIPTN